MNWRSWAGIVSCLVLIAAGFMHWAWYPDIQQYFTGWHSEQNYYGKPGKVMTIFAVLAMLFFLVNKNWSKRLNLVLAAINLGYAIKSYILFSMSYDGFVPKASMGLYLMVLASLAYAVFAVLVFGSRQVSRPVSE